ncbi:MAG TPA: hypothetical protein RMH80_17900, partial [Polyangiaceae bacterium LLY-WYZ-15_(1-7)]|nr:hypothetical protein [Polyangiaceae bacterium LLY-WYZ-15_(1-7)]
MRALDQGGEAPGTTDAEGGEAPGSAPVVEGPENSESPATVDEGRPSALPLATGLAFIAGLASLASEVLWTRVLRMVVQGTTQAFAAMLVNFLLGIALGSLLADRLVRRGGDPRRLFGITQLLLLLLTGVAMMVAPQLPRLLAMAQDGASLVPHEAGPILLLAALLLFPLALVLGTSVPLAWRIAGGDAAQAAHHSGRVLAANTLGGLLGSLAAGFFLVPNIGIEASVLVVALVHGLASMIALASSTRESRTRLVGILVPALALGGLLSLQPRLHVAYLVEARRDIARAVIEGPGDEWRQALVFLEEGRNTTVTVSQRNPGSLQLFNDGRPESGFSAGEPGFGAELVLLGSLPNVFVPERRSALVVGLGGGHSTSVLAEPGWESVEVVELEEAVVHAARFMHESFDEPFPLDRPEVSLTVDDARAQLVLSPPESLDAVVSQPSHPWLAGSSALYTEEFFREVQRALRHEGVFSLWVNRFRIEERHLRSVVGTLLAVFEHVQAFVVEYSSFVLVASDAPLTTSAERFRELGGEGTYFDAIGMDRMGFVGALELDTAGARAWTEGAARIVDDRPTLEFELAQLPEQRDLSTSDLDQALLAIPWASRETLAGLGVAPLEGALARVDGVRDRRAALDRLERSLPALQVEAPVERALVGAAIAEARGDFARALDLYDEAMASPEAVRRADALRDAERLHAGLLRRWRRAGRAAPSDPAPYVLAALAEGDREAAVELLAAHPDWASPLRAFAEAWATADCAAALAHVASLRDDRSLAVAARCASELGRFDAARALLERAGRARRLASHRWTTRALPMLETNTGLAVRYLMRALAANAGHAKAAEELAKALHAHGER